MLLTITEIGHQLETEALTSGYFPSVEAIVIGDGVPHADPKSATALVHQVLSVPISVVERLSSQAVRFHATIPQGQTVVIRELGLLLEGGSLYGYLPYATVMGEALHKHASFAFSFSLAVSREPLPPVEVNYSPVDTGEIARMVAAQAQAVIDAGGTVLRSGDIGEVVQPYDATTLKAEHIGELVQAFLPEATDEEIQDGSEPELRSMSPRLVSLAVQAAQTRALPDLRRRLFFTGGW